MSSIKIQIRIDEHEDADMYQWIQSLPYGTKSAQIRAAIRRGFSQYTLTQNDFDYMRGLFEEVIYTTLKPASECTSETFIRENCEEDGRYPAVSQYNPQSGGYSPSVNGWGYIGDDKNK